MLLLIYYLLKFINPILIPLCFFLAWTFLFLLVWTLWQNIRDLTKQARQMHKIPCTHCQFFTNISYLKCTVRPDIANTEQAIHCLDYYSQDLIKS